MTLTIHTEEDEQRQLLVTVEVAEERVQKTMRRTARRLAREIHVPGFRKGKAPYGVILRRVGTEALRAETIDEMAPHIFEEVLAEVETDVYAQPSLTDMEVKPLVLKFNIPLMPQITLGDYRTIRKEIEPIAISDEAVEEALGRIRERHQELEEVDRPVELTDMVTLAGVGHLVLDEVDSETEEDEDTTPEVEEVTAEETAVAEDEHTDEASERDDDIEETAVDPIIFDEERINFIMDSTKTFPGTSFVDNIIGLSAGDEKTFSFVFPEDDEDETIAGQEATFEITVLDVQKRTLPELDDELAKLEGDYETLDALRESLHENLEEEAKTQAKDELLEGMVDDLLADAELIYPPIAVQLETEDMVKEFRSQVERSGWGWEDFLRLQGKQPSDLQEDFRENASKRLQRRLVLQQFIIDEMLRVEAADIDAMIDKRVSRFENEDLRNSMREYFQQGSAFDLLSSEILMEKVSGRIEAIVTGQAPDLEELASEVGNGADEEE